MDSRSVELDFLTGFFFISILGLWNLPTLTKPYHVCNCNVNKSHGILSQKEKTAPSCLGAVEKTIELSETVTASAQTRSDEYSDRARGETPRDPRDQQR